jgi:hypothetical protein
MRLPEAAARCMAMLEKAGFAAYAENLFKEMENAE